jgi:hypothetical protein
LDEHLAFPHLPFNASSSIAKDLPTDFWSGLNGLSSAGASISGAIGVVEAEQRTDIQILRFGLVI